MTKLSRSTEATLRLTGGYPETSLGLPWLINAGCGRIGRSEESDDFCRKSSFNFTIG